MSITIRPADLADEAEDVTALLVDYMTRAHRQFLEAFGFRGAPTDISGLRDSLGEYGGSSNVLLVAEDSDRGLVGVAGLRSLELGVVEVKRMYVVPECRGLRVGSLLLDGLLEEAQRMGASAVRLDTARFMVEAQRLYRSRGFVERPPYPGTEIPQDLHEFWVFFQLPIGPPAADEPQAQPA
ncbi:GNAT family N-acetyltransferase [Amycolatopsis sp. NPDC058986]|uniref:GNAT family N-acetyltransferase n=1 Tax=unclassified Amycolatopsis TaxID=2618356 RepID=UPI00366DF7B0